MKKKTFQAKKIKSRILLNQTRTAKQMRAQALRHRFFFCLALVCVADQETSRPNLCVLCKILTLEIVRCALLSNLVTHLLNLIAPQVSWTESLTKNSIGVILF